MRNSRQKPAVSWQRRLLRFVCAVLAIILTVMISVTVYVETLFGKLGREETDASSLIGAVTEYIPSNGSLIHSENTINIMLVGTDLSEARSDTMILCTIDTGSKTVTLTSFLRDTYVEIPDYFPHKMNTAYALDGFTALNNTLAENFGVRVDGNVAISFDSFISIVDIVGGVEIELTEEEVDYMMNTRWNGLDASGWELYPGVQRLNGDQALAYSRIRDVEDSEGNYGDFGRTSRQRRVLSQMLRECRGLSVIQMNTLLNEILPMVTTNLSSSQIISYGLDMLPILSNLTIETRQIPAEGTYHLDWVEQDGGMSVIWVDDFDANRELLEQIIGN